MTEPKVLPIEYLRKRLRYEPDTGKLFWLDHDGMPQKWRTRWAGREAFTTVHSKGYRCGGIDNRSYLTHRVIWALVYGTWPKDQIDHKNGDKIDNRLVNLRDVSHAENRKNVSKQSNNTSGACGVRWDKRREKWQAQIMVGRKFHHLGLFTSFDDAVAARRAADKLYGFSERHGT
jgi:hypothetical protein